LERVREYHATPADQKAIRKRQVWVEPLFAEAKDWHGLRRFRLRGLERVNGEALLIAAGQNLKRLLNHRGWGRRPWPGGVSGIAVPPPSRIGIALRERSTAVTRQGSPPAPATAGPFSTGW
jgi:hypothetical protein